jgi:NSS family neurotransmitter:Na+ symporter
MLQTTNKRSQFTGAIGLIMTTVGSAVGLGNIWRFPYMLGSNGGAAFLLIYILCTLLLGLPVMIAEFYIGRASRCNAAGAFKVLAPKTKWSIIGYNGVLAAFLILGFYSVIAGWTLEYIFQSVTQSLSGKTVEIFTAQFAEFSSDAVRPIFWSLIFIVLTCLIIVIGVEKGIEKWSKFLMPMLFLILIILCIRSLTMPGAAEGLSFLFKPDFSKITSSVILSAMGQAFFSLSVGMGCLITYSSYFGKNINLQTTALNITLIDTFIAILGGIMIFPAVFSFGIEPTQGPSLVFITLPNVFAKMALANVWSCIFFILLAVAALTSTISLHEVATAYLHEEKKISRKKAAWFVSGGVAFLTIISSLSFGLLKDMTVFGLTFFDLLDYLTAKLMLPLGGMMICIFVGWRVEKKILKAELTNNHSVAYYFFTTYGFLLRYIAPVAIAIIFLNEIGLFNNL